MFGWDDAQNNYQQTQDPNQAELSHEVLAGGASFFAMHEWENHQRKEGKEVSHGFAKEAIAAIAGAEVDRLAETKGADYIDREKAKREARQRSEQLYDQHYGQDDNYNPNRRERHENLQQQFGGQGGYGGGQGGYGGDQGGYGGDQGGYGGDQGGYGGQQGGYGNNY